MHLLKIEEVADFLQVDIQTIKHWVKTGDLLAYNLSRSMASKKPHLRFRQTDLDDFLESRHPKTHESRPTKSRPTASWKKRMEAVGLPVK